VEVAHVARQGYPAIRQSVQIERRVVHRRHFLACVGVRVSDSLR
jgi:hypothetical protein